MAKCSFVEYICTTGTAGSVPQLLVLGNGFNLQAAQITAGNSANTQAFYAQSLPAAGTPVRFQSWKGKRRYLNYRRQHQYYKNSL